MKQSEARECLLDRRYPGSGRLLRPEADDRLQLAEHAGVGFAVGSHGCLPVALFLHLDNSLISRESAAHARHSDGFEDFVV